ncbi:MAG: protein kinase, partial [Desulfomonile sp.]|nr:protein kinase [Desulfomonile sp.]
RRLCVSYKKTDQFEQAAIAWEKVKALGGLKTPDDYALGIEILTAQGKYALAAETCLQLIAMETDEDKLYEIRKSLFEIYRRSKNAEKLVELAAEILAGGTSEPELVSDTVRFLVAEDKTDLAVKSNNREIISRIAEEFLEEKAMTPQAERIYRKYLEYDRTDQRVHRILAEMATKEGDFRKAVSQLTILHQLDKENPEEYVEQAAKLYVDNGRVADALAEGNPKIIRKIAQIYLSNSAVNPDAVAVYEKVLETQPRLVGINKMLSTVYLTRGDLDRYMEKLRLLHEIDGTNHDYLADLAKCIVDNDLIDATLREGNRELNIKILKELIKREASDDRAVAIFEKLVRHDPENVLLQGALAKAYEGRGDYRRAFDTLVTLARLKPEDKEVPQRAAAIAVQHNLLDDVVQKAHGMLLQITARELIKRNVVSSDCRQVLAKALQESPGDERLKSYLDTLPTARAAVPRASAAPAPGPIALELTESSEPIIILTREEQPAPPPKEKKVTPPPSLPPKPLPAPQKEVPPRPPRPEKQKPPEIAKTAPPPPSEEQAVNAKTSKIPVYQPGPVTTFVSAHENEMTQAEIKPKQVIDYRITPEAPSSGRPVTTFVTAHDKEVSEPEFGDQVIEVKTPPKLFSSEAPVTTFVSGFDKTGPRIQYREEDLFRALAGGMAYLPEEEISSDGWGVWKKAVEVNTGRRQLIRALDPTLMKSELMEEEAMEQFVVGVSRLASILKHQNILELQDVVSGPGKQPGLVHACMDRSLQHILESPSRPDLGTLLTWVRQIVSALAFAESLTGLRGEFQAVRHLHIDPKHIFVSEDLTECKLTGLGFTQVYRATLRVPRARWQDPGANPAFMAPELFRAKPSESDEQVADVYSLGILMYVMFTGMLPFDGPSTDDFKFQHTKIFPSPPRLANPTLPDWIESLVLVCLEKDPGKRWKNAAEIERVLNRNMKGV